MGTSHSTAQLVRKIDTYATSIGKANRAGTSAAALRYKEQALRNVTADTGGDRRMSQIRRRYGFGDGGPKMGVGYKLLGYNNAKAIINPRPYGVWVLLDGGSVAHRIVPFRYRKKRGGGLRAAEVAAIGRGGSARAALSVPGAGRDGAGFAAFVNHPGSKGKRTFRRVPAQAKTAAVRSFHRSHHQALLDVFK